MQLMKSFLSHFEKFQDKLHQYQIKINPKTDRRVFRILSYLYNLPSNLEMGV